jgi:hypothetical protein
MNPAIALDRTIALFEADLAPFANSPSAKPASSAYWCATLSLVAVAVA